ncbi:SAM-dependent methyltransferase [Exiguobacterium oxidotolerans]|uniref:SAM-dependent methyltransferase n=1 Tax=Exiguobacterium oxidotolerans TaxID=223958 RepID=A0A653IH10_9BACL|nr:class I SAM-dependent methyltransferase [Exiguobacterium oxidotolerans]VWX38565.1 SAM-dependent methyltransferase [Exiguobacterium oxidotolerans]
MKELIQTHDDLLDMLDDLLREPTAFWNGFYADRDKRIPFFVNKPDENLVRYFERGIITPGHVLELGCGPGRNALYFARQGCTVTAVDLSRQSLDWARERAQEEQLEIEFIEQNIFELTIAEGSCDVIYDSGCFHHIAPHRRRDYLKLVTDSLTDGGYFALTCFIEGGDFGGSDISDWEVYRTRSLNGGLGFTEEKLRLIFADFDVVEIRPMLMMPVSATTFGLSGLWTALFQRKAR